MWVGSHRPLGWSKRRKTFVEVRNNQPFTFNRGRRVIPPRSSGTRGVCLRRLHTRTSQSPHTNHAAPSLERGRRRTDVGRGRGGRCVRARRLGRTVSGCLGCGGCRGGCQRASVVSLDRTRREGARHSRFGFVFDPPKTLTLQRPHPRPRLPSRPSGHAGVAARPRHRPDRRLLGGRRVPAGGRAPARAPRRGAR